jgi:hypothetical protein
MLQMHNDGARMQTYARNIMVFALGANIGVIVDLRRVDIAENIEKLIDTKE